MIVDLFSGAGGWTLGAARHHLQVTGYDYDPYAMDTYRSAGFDGVLADLTTLDPVVCTGILASPPCQPYSVAGKQQGRADTRAMLPLLVAQWAQQDSVRWVAVEQVEGAASVINRLAAMLVNLGFHAALREVHAEAFGVPQTRTRIVLMASRDRHPTTPQPSHSMYNRHKKRRLQRGVLPWVSMADALEREFEPGHWAHTRPSPTIVGSFRPEVVAAPGYRVLTSRQDTPGSVTVTVPEAGILQGFPEDYPWKGPVTARYRAVGNAFPPPVAAAVIKELL